jgi:hypothetical protein
LCQFVLHTHIIIEPCLEAEEVEYRSGTYN